MKYLDLTFSTPAQNLACDEALIDWVEGGAHQEILRFWEPQQHFVVVGYANKVETEVNVQACRACGVPIFRRSSGGGTVLQGPGCLNYSLILGIEAHGGLHSITETNRFVMERQQAALASLLGSQVGTQGITDLTLGALKFSGNAQRRKRDYLLFHGTFLLQFDLDLIQHLLRPPSKQPDYRQNRSHKQFLTNLALNAAAIKAALRQQWGAVEVLPETALPLVSIEQLAQEKYATDAWNYKF